MALLQNIINFITLNPIALGTIPLLLYVVLLLQSYFRLSHIPGPFVACWTNIPRFSWVLSFKAHDIHTALHRKYGPLVRFGPNMVSVGDPKEVSHIYGFTYPWMKILCLSIAYLDDANVAVRLLPCASYETSR